MVLSRAVNSLRVSHAYLNVAKQCIDVFQECSVDFLVLFSRYLRWVDLSTRKLNLMTFTPKYCCLTFEAQLNHSFSVSLHCQVIYPVIQNLVSIWVLQLDWFFAANVSSQDQYWSNDQLILMTVDSLFLEMHFRVNEMILPPHFCVMIGLTGASRNWTSVCLC